MHSVWRKGEKRFGLIRLSSSSRSHHGVHTHTHTYISHAILLPLKIIFKATKKTKRKLERTNE